MGVLLSICFKTKDQDGSANPQHQAKKRKGKKSQQQQPSNPLSLSKQHLLGTPDQGNPRQQGYNSMTMPQSPKPQSNNERPSPPWGRPPDSPAGRDKDTPSQLFSPPTPPTPTQREPDKRPILGKALSFNLGIGKDRNASSNKIGRKRKSTKT